MEIIKASVLVIGAGPIGLFAAFMCGMLGMRCSVLEAQDHVGGQCRILYPQKLIYDIPALPSIKALDLIHSLYHQAAPFSPFYYLGEQAEKLDRDQDLWHVISSKNRCFSSSAIILCCGLGSFAPKRPPIPSIKDFENKSVFYSIASPDRFIGKRVVIAGGGDSAIDWALALAHITKKLYLVHRRSQFRAQNHGLAQLMMMHKDGQINILSPFQIHDLRGNNGVLSHVLIRDFEGEIKELEADYLLPFFGLDNTLGTLTSWGMAMDKNLICIDPLTGQTSQSSIYAAGDIATYPRKIKLILTGFSEATQAAYHIREHLFPTHPHIFTHSTTSGINPHFL